MNDIYTENIQKALSFHKQGNFDEAEKIYNRVLNRKHFNEDLLFLLGDLYIRKEYNGLGIILLTSLLMNNDKNANAWLNLGVAFRKENFFIHAKQAWKKAIEAGGETAEVCNNMAGLYADHGEPEKAIEWSDKALALSDSPEMKWQKSLALLTMRKWEEGWKLYEERYGLEAWHSRVEIEAPLWDFSQTEHLYLHGEQGVGDEVMFLSCLDEIRPLAKKITLELNEKVCNIARLTWPDIDVVSEPLPGKYTAKLPIGTLACRLRRQGNFPGHAFLKPDPKRIDFYKQKLKELGKGPYVALTWFGGSKQTRVEERSLSLSWLKPIMQDYTCVSAQYEHTNPVLSKEREQNGLHKIDDLCIGLDLAEQAALFEACDAVISVQQSAVHVAGAVGTRTFAMISEAPHWRYGIKHTDMPWYKSVSLHRKERNESWQSLIERLRLNLDAHFGRIQEPKQATA